LIHDEKVNKLIFRIQYLLIYPPDVDSLIGFRLHGFRLTGLWLQSTHIVSYTLNPAISRGGTLAIWGYEYGSIRLLSPDRRWDFWLSWMIPYPQVGCMGEIDNLGLLFGRRAILSVWAPCLTVSMPNCVECFREVQGMYNDIIIIICGSVLRRWWSVFVRMLLWRCKLLFKVAR